MMEPQANDRLPLPETRQGVRPASTLISDFDLITEREYISVVLSHFVVVICDSGHRKGMRSRTPRGDEPEGDFCIFTFCLRSWPRVLFTLSLTD